MTALSRILAHALAARRFHTYAGAVLVLLLFSVGELGRVGGARAVAWWANGGWTLCAMAAVGGCLAAARRDRSGRRGWLFIAGGCGIFLGGQLVWDYSQLLANLTLPFPSLGDAGYMGLPPLAVAGILALPRVPERRRTTFKGLSLLDAIIVALSLTFIGIVAVQGVLRPAGPLPLLGRATALAYPAIYLTMGFTLFLFILRAPSIVITRGMALLFIGLACEEMAFVVYVPLVVTRLAPVRTQGRARPPKGIVRGGAVRHIEDCGQGVNHASVAWTHSAISPQPSAPQITAHKALATIASNACHVVRSTRGSSHTAQHAPLLSAWSCSLPSLPQHAVLLSPS